MSTTVAQWKAQMESEVRNNIEKFVVLPEIDSAGTSAELSRKTMDFKALGHFLLSAAAIILARCS